MNDGGLAGCGVLITRPEHQSQDLVSEIEAAGGKVFRFPTIDIIGRNIDEIGMDFAALVRPNIVVFVSGNAVAYGLAAVRGKRQKIAAIGPATRAAIEAVGVSVDIFPEDGFDSEHLLQHDALQSVDGKRIVIVRGQSGRELLAETLRERGAQVDYLYVYDRIQHEPTLADLENLETALSEGRIGLVTAMSVENAGTPGTDSAASILEITSEIDTGGAQCSCDTNSFRADSRNRDRACTGPAGIRYGHYAD